MSRTVASDMAHRSLDALFERLEQQGHYSMDEARELLASCEIGGMVLERLWQFAQACLDRGMEASRLIAVLKELADVANVGAKSFQAACDRIQDSDLAADEKSQGISALMRAGRRASQMGDELMPMLRWLMKPTSTVDASA